MISKDIYERLLQIRATKPQTDALRQEVHDINRMVLNLIPEMPPLKFMNTAIDMYEGKIPHDRFYRECKSCGETYKVWRSMGKARQYICKNCVDKNIGWCYVHDMQIIGTICQQCQIEESHKRFTDENKSSYVECTICGHRAALLAAHYKAIHNLSRDVYSAFEIVCEELKESMRGTNNPAFGHGGRLSPFSKNFKNYKNEDDYLNGFKAVLEKANQTKIEHPEKNNTRIEYYIAQGMTEDEARDALYERQAAFTLDKCVERYGTEEGQRIWQDRQDRWQETLNSKSQKEIDLINKKKAMSIDGFVARGFSIEEAEKLLKEILVNRNTGYSKESVKFFRTFIPNEIWDKAYHTTNEWFLYDNQHRRCYFYDFMYKDVIVEYHGEVYHPNRSVLTEEQWSKWKHAKSKKSADEVSEYDNTKMDLAIQNGFTFFHVYSNDTDEQKERIKKLILEAIWKNLKRDI